MIVHESVKDELIAAIARVAATITLGHPFEPATQMGALIDQGHMQRVLGYIDIGVAEGARVALGGKAAMARAAATMSRPPFSTGCVREMRVSREEIFGPGARRDQLQRGSGRARHGERQHLRSRRGGLDFRHECRPPPLRLRCAPAPCGSTLSTALPSRTPFGGFKQSGFGRDRSPHAIDKYADLKTIWTAYR